MRGTRNSPSSFLRHDMIPTSLRALRWLVVRLSLPIVSLPSSIFVTPDARASANDSRTDRAREDVALAVFASRKNNLRENMRGGEKSMMGERGASSVH